jgi:hypothetical protein
MPGIIGPGPGIGSLLNGQGATLDTIGGGEFTKDVRPSQAIRAWHDLTVTLAQTMPRSLIRTDHLQRGALLALQRHGRVR